MMTESEKIDRERGRDAFFFMSFFYFLGFLNIGVYETFGSMTFLSGLHNISGARQRLICLPYHIANIIVSRNFIVQ